MFYFQQQVISKSRPSRAKTEIREVRRVCLPFYILPDLGPVTLKSTFDCTILANTLENWQTHSRIQKIRNA